MRRRRRDPAHAGDGDVSNAARLERTHQATQKIQLRSLLLATLLTAARRVERQYKPTKLIGRGHTGSLKELVHTLNVLSEGVTSKNVDDKLLKAVSLIAAYRIHLQKQDSTKLRGALGEALNQVNLHTSTGGFVDAVTFIRDMGFPITTRGMEEPLSSAQKSPVYGVSFAVFKELRISRKGQGARALRIGAFKAGQRVPTMFDCLKILSPSAEELNSDSYVPQPHAPSAADVTAAKAALVKAFDKVERITHPFGSESVRRSSKADGDEDGVEHPPRPGSSLGSSSE